MNRPQKQRSRRSVHDLRKVIAWMGGTLVAFCALAISVRELAHSLSVFEILALRNVGGIIVLAGYSLLAARARIGAPRPLGIHLLRNLVHVAGQALWAYGLIRLPLATTFALEFTTPAWTMVMAVLFLHERLTRGRIGAVVLGFIGVLTILRPGTGTFDPVALVVLLAAVMFAVQLTTTKFLTGSNSVLTILFWMNIMQLPLYLLAQAATGGSVWLLPKLQPAMAPAIAALCVSGLMAHVCLTNAFRHGDAIAVVPIDFLRIPLITMVGVVFYREVFDQLVLLGAAISAAGILWSLRNQPPPRPR
jgi:drug/metabolite transporter (DMT)-like permease